MLPQLKSWREKATPGGGGVGSCSIQLQLWSTGCFLPLRERRGISHPLVRFAAWPHQIGDAALRDWIGYRRPEVFRRGADVAFKQASAVEHPTTIIEMTQPRVGLYGKGTIMAGASATTRYRPRLVLNCALGQLGGAKSNSAAPELHRQVIRNY